METSGAFHYKNGSFAYSTYGSGKDVILLHGFLENRRMWLDLIENLPKGFRFICLDLPGHGDSDNLGYIHTMEEMAEVVKALADQLELQKFILGGHSMGGYVTLAYAEKYPQDLNGLILQNTTTLPDSPEKKKDRLRAIAVVKQNPQLFINHSIPNLFKPENRELLFDEIEKIKSEALKTSPQGIVAALEGMRIRKGREEILSGEIPILFIAAQHDPVLPWESLEPQLKYSCVTPVLTQNGHMAHVEDREELVKGMVDWLIC